MTKLTILRGVSGNGKSTWAKQQNAVVVSRDDLRAMLFGSADKDYYAVDKDVLFAREQKVTVAQDALISAYLKAGQDVIVDNTNTEWKFVKSLAKIGARYGAEVEVKVFDVPLAVAVERNAMRHAMGGRLVDTDILRKQHQRLAGNKNMVLEPAFVPKHYTGTPGKPKAFLVDIDGTLAHMRGKRGPFDWAKVGLDEPDEVIAGIVNAMHNVPHSSGKGGREYKVIVMSGRDEVCREDTKYWLSGVIEWYEELFMRPQGDMRPDNIVKAELFDKYVRDNFDVKFVLDDRDQVVDMWRKMGLTCLQVAEGDF